METPVTAGFWLSPQQKHVWALQQDGGTLRSVCQLRVDRPLKEASVLEGLRSLIGRHEILRTVYLRQPGMKYPFQAVLDQAEPSLRTVDLSGLSELQQNEKLEEGVHDEQVAVAAPDSSRILSAAFVILGAERHYVVFSVRP